MSAKLLKIDDIQEILGIGRNKAYKLLQSGEIAGFKIGREWKISAASVEAFIAKHNADVINDMKYGGERCYSDHFKRR